MKKIVYGIKVPETVRDNVCHRHANNNNLVYFEKEKILGEIIVEKEEFTIEETVQLIKENKTKEWHFRYLAHISDMLRRYSDEDRYVAKPDFVII